MSLIRNLIQSRRPDFSLPFPTWNGKEKPLAVQRIMYLLSDGNATTFYLANKHNPSIPLTISTCETLLTPYAFVRIHRGTLVNTSFIANIRWTGEAQLSLYDGTILPIARRRKKTLKDQIQKLELDHL